MKQLGGTELCSVVNVRGVTLRRALDRSGLALTLINSLPALSD